MKQRLDDIKSAIKELSKVSDSNSGDVNKALSKTRKNVEGGINYPEKASSFSAIFDGKEEKGISDPDLSQADSQLNKELADTQKKLDEAQYQLKIEKNRRERIKDEIRAEERRIKESS